MLTKNGRRNRSPTYIQLVSNSESPTRDSLNLFSTELGDHQSPLADSGGTDLQRPRDIRGALIVINNGLLKHRPSLTAVHMQVQPQFTTRVLTSVHMDTLSTLEGRLRNAMAKAGTSASDLARECDVSPVAVGKWLKGGKMKADSLAKASRALGVRDEWLRTGKLPMEREHGHEERQFDQVIDLLQQLRGPLAALSAAIDQLTPSTATERKKHPR
jgi:transcriptional regulator with XRE-family HTH domain